MTRPGLEVADVIRSLGPRDLEAVSDRLSLDHKRVLGDLAACRTSALGGHVEACDRCDHQRIAYNSCRNRHCPKCQATARAKWMEARSAELLPVPYFHVVFTLPACLGPMALQNKRIVYGLLFRAASQTLVEIAADPKHLGARIGFLAVLHTWGQNLMHHPHLHCVVPAGGLSLDGSKWVRSRKGFFLPVRVLSKVFRGKFIAMLKEAYRSGKLTFFGKLAGLSQAQRFEQHLNASVKTDWVVYAKRPFGGPQQVLKYLARYTHRVAISNRRLVSMKNGRVTFRWKDYAQGHRQRTMTLKATEFIRRFLLHVLPSGFMRIRHFGFMANRHRQEKLDRCRQLLGSAPTVTQPCDTNAKMPSSQISDRCPLCKIGRIVVIEKLPPKHRAVNRYIRTRPAIRSPASVPGWDTS